MAAEADMGPIRIELGTIAIFGGGLKHAWVPDISVVDGITFMRLSATNRKLAALCGCKLACSHPLKDNTFIQKIVDLRNQKHTELVNAFWDAQDVDPRVKRAKRSAYDDIPKMFSIVVPGFEMFAGGHAADREMRVLLSVSVLECVSIELTLNNLDFVVRGIKAHFVEEPLNRNVKVAFDDCPNVRWNKGRRSVYIMYINEDGKKKTRFFKPQASDIPEVFAERVKEEARKAQQEYYHLHAPLNMADD